MSPSFFPLFCAFFSLPAGAAAPLPGPAALHAGILQAARVTLGAAPEPGSPFKLQTEGADLCVFDTRTTGTPGAETDLAALLRDRDIVYAGETHDQSAHHLAQLEALKALFRSRGSKTVVGFEMLNVTLQPVLDDYAAGRISEEEFLRLADWKKEWGFDFSLYRPLFDFVRANKLRALALNLPKKIVSKIAREGLAALSPEERQFIPPDFKVSADERYLAYLKQSFEGHDGGMGGMLKFENYLAAMSAWNEAMGWRLADFMKASPGWAALAVAGSGHVIYNAGLPASVNSRADGLRQASFYLLDAAFCPASLPASDAGLADYVWYVVPAAGAGQGDIK